MIFSFSDATLCSESVDNELELREANGQPITAEARTRICEEAGVDWKWLLRHLGIRESKIEVIEEENRQIYERCYQGLLEWEKRSGSNATIEKLEHALRIIKKKNVAARIEGKLL